MFRHRQRITASGVLGATVLAGLLALPGPGTAANLSRPVRLTPQAGPTGVAFTPDGGTALVADVGLGQVSVVDVARHRQRAVIAVGSQPTDVAITPDGARAFVTNSNSDTVSVIDIGRRRVVRTVNLSPGGSWPNSVTIAGGKAYVVNQDSGTLSVLSARTGALRRTISLGGASTPAHAAAAPDGKTLYVDRHDHSDVAVVDVATDRVTGSIPMPESPADVQVTKDGRRLLVATDAAGIMIVSLSKRRALRLIPIPGLGLGARSALSPDGRWLYVVSAGDINGSEVFLVDVPAERYRGRLNGFATPVAVSTSPQGRWAFVSNFRSDTLGVAWQPGKLPLRVDAAARDTRPKVGRWTRLVRRTDWAADLDQLTARVTCRPKWHGTHQRTCAVRRPRPGVVQVKPRVAGTRITVRVTTTPAPHRALYRQRSWTRTWQARGVPTGPGLG